MKNFEEAKITIISFDRCDDIITTSGTTPGYGGNNTSSNNGVIYEWGGDDITGVETN